MGELFGGEAAQAAEELASVGDEILMGYKTYGEGLGGADLAAYPGSTRYASAIEGTGGVFREPYSTESERLKQIAKESKQFALDVQTSALDEAGQILAGLGDLEV